MTLRRPGNSTSGSGLAKIERKPNESSRLCSGPCGKSDSSMRLEAAEAAGSAWLRGSRRAVRVRCSRQELPVRLDLRETVVDSVLKNALNFLSAARNRVAPDPKPYSTTGGRHFNLNLGGGSERWRILEAFPNYNSSPTMPVDDRRSICTRAGRKTKRHVNPFRISRYQLSSKTRKGRDLPARIVRRCFSDSSSSVKRACVSGHAPNQIESRLRASTQTLIQKVG